MRGEPAVIPLLARAASELDCQAFAHEGRSVLLYY